jgi:hypothetical protein
LSFIVPPRLLVSRRVGHYVVTESLIPVEQGGGATRAIVRLTKRAIDQVKPLHKPYFVWDGELKGFGARIDPGGAKTFAVRYRPKGHGASAPKRFITIGRYGPLTVDEARNRAKEILVPLRRARTPPPISR